RPTSPVTMEGVLCERHPVLNACCPVVSDTSRAGGPSLRRRTTGYGSAFRAPLARRSFALSLGGHSDGIEQLIDVVRLRDDDDAFSEWQLRRAGAPRSARRYDYGRDSSESHNLVYFEGADLPARVTRPAIGDDDRARVIVQRRLNF